MMPFSGSLRKVNRSTQTPIVALLVFAVIDVGVMIYGYFQSSAFGTLVGATAIIPYIIYFLITLAYAIKRRTLDSLPGAFNLGRWAWPVIGFVLVYTVLVMLVLSLPAPFHGSDKVLGYGLALAALWYFGGLLWRLKKGTAGVKPVEDLVRPAPAAVSVISLPNELGSCLLERTLLARTASTRHRSCRAAASPRRARSSGPVATAAVSLPGGTGRWT